MIATLAFVLWCLRQGVLRVFGAVIAAVLLHVLASFISDWTRISCGPSSALATSILIAVIGFTAWRFGATLSSQITELVRHIESGAADLL